MLISLNLEPILTNNEYLDVLTLNRMPEGPLATMVKQIRTQDLSIFEQGLNKNPCKYALFDPATNLYMVKDDIPFIFSYLADNGYTIDTQMTKLYKVHSKTLICLFL